MLRDNKYLYDTLLLLDTLQNELNIEYDKSNKYDSIIKGLKEIASYKNCKEHSKVFIIKKELRLEIENFFNSMNINKFKKRVGNFYTLMTTGYTIENELEIPEYDLDILSDIYLLRFLASFLQCISFTQNNNLLLLKYNKCIWNFGYNNLTNICRGKVLDINKKEIISYPFDKFFNLDECAETKIDKVQNLLSKANYISVMDKADGSTIIVTKTENELIINTNGGFTNIQVKIAKKLLSEKYNHFLSNMKLGYTYIFELIHPMDRKVVNYNGVKKLLLLAVRDLSDNGLLKYEECAIIASDLKLDMIECFEFTSLDDFINLSHSLKNSNKEGWVIRVITEDEDIMFKLKINEYCILHKSVLGKVNAFDIYQLMYEDTIDDAISKADEGNKILILDMIEKINCIMHSTENSLIKSLEIVKSKFDISQEEFQEIVSTKNRQHPKYQIRLDLIKYIHSNCKDYYDIEGITAYYKNGLSVYEFIKSIDLIKFKVLCRKKNLLNDIAA